MWNQRLDSFRIIQYLCYLTWYFSVVGLVLSIVSYDDIIRDRMDYMMGFPSPSLINNSSGKASLNQAPNPDIPGSKFSVQESRKPNAAERFIYRYSLLANRLNPGFSQSLSRQLTRYAQNNASNEQVIDEIIAELKSISVKYKIPAMVVIQYGNNKHDFYLKGRNLLINKGEGST